MNSTSSDCILFELNVSELDDSLHHITASANSSIQVLGTTGMFVYSNKLSELESSGEVVDTQQETGTLSKGNNLIQFHRSAKTHWAYQVFLPKSELLKEASQIYKFTNYTVIIASLVSLSIGYLSYQLVNKPLMRLNELMKLAENGDFTVRNTSIESARVGAAGKGFTIIANEIKSLAEESKSWLRDVLGIMESIQFEMSEVAETMTQLRPSFHKQTQTLKTSDQIFKNLQTTMEDFAAKVAFILEAIQHAEIMKNQLHESIFHISAVSEQATASTQQISALSQNQSMISGELADISDEMKLLATSLNAVLLTFIV